MKMVAFACVIRHLQKDGGSCLKMVAFACVIRHVQTDGGNCLKMVAFACRPTHKTITNDGRKEDIRRMEIIVGISICKFMVFFTNELTTATL